MIDSRLNDYLKQSGYARRANTAAPENGAESRWLAKPVLDSRVLCECNSLDGIKHNGIGTMSLSDRRSHSGSHSVMLDADTDTGLARPRPSSQICLSFDGADWQEWNRISVWVYPEAEGFRNFYFHMTLENDETDACPGTARFNTHVPNLEPNCWNHVVWEIPHFPRNSVRSLKLAVVLMGKPPEALPQLNVFFDDITLEKVKPDNTLGWDIKDTIAYCHSGYLPGAKKLAAARCAADTFFLSDAENGCVVFQAPIKREQTELGLYDIMDFSDFKDEGLYILKAGALETNPFPVSENAYDLPAWKSLNFLYTLRCGFDVPNVHSSCHLTSYTRHPDGRVAGNWGGWHDAGDVSQFEICTAEMAHALVEFAFLLRDINPELGERSGEEARWGIEWLLRTRFGDGFRVLGVSYYVWTDNITTPDKLVRDPSDGPCYPAENGPFENWLAAAAEGSAARYFEKEDPVFAAWCLRCAKEDFAFAAEGHEAGLFTKRWGVVPPAQIYGAAVVAAAELYRVTGDEFYIEKAAAYAKIVLSCQQSELPEWEKPLRGFFYENPEHTHILTYEHRGHEQSPVQGLVMLCEAAPEHRDAVLWRQGVELYAEYIRETRHLCEPFGMLPAQVYNPDMLNLSRFTIPGSYGTAHDNEINLKRQIIAGISLGGGFYLRRFPIAIQRRGYHATLLSKTKAVSCAARLLNDRELMQTAVAQLEWILGRNPFSSSTMYGEGYNFHPLYAAFSPQLTGALPVGIKTLGDTDEPFWPAVNNAVFKEIWGHTTGKFIWVLSDVLKFFGGGVKG